MKVQVHHPNFSFTKSLLVRFSAKHCIGKEEQQLLVLLQENLLLLYGI
jgi:hypothetical protein